MIVERVTSIYDIFFLLSSYFLWGFQPIGMQLPCRTFFDPPSPSSLLECSCCDFVELLVDVGRFFFSARHIHLHCRQLYVIPVNELCFAIAFKPFLYIRLGFFQVFCSLYRNCFILEPSVWVNPWFMQIFDSAGLQYWMWEIPFRIGINSRMNSHGSRNDLAGISCSFNSQCRKS